MINLLRLRAGSVNVIVSLSGGKDSAATALHLRELGIPFSCVFADTGWEADATYDYLTTHLDPLLGPITRVCGRMDVAADAADAVAQVEAILGRPSAMVRACIREGMFPSRLSRFCTADLKVRPLLAHFQAQAAADARTVVNVVGIRGDESTKRAALDEWEVEPALDSITWRPLMRWSVEDVLAIHERNGLPLNPLYRRGMSRVGCWPCINARKGEYPIIERDVRRVEALRVLERLVGERAGARGLRAPTWHGGDSRPGHPLGPQPQIDKVLAWAKTGRRGLTDDVEEVEADPGCVRFGLCEGPT